MTRDCIEVVQPIKPMILHNNLSAHIEIFANSIQQQPYQPQRIEIVHLAEPQQISHSWVFGDRRGEDVPDLVKP